MEGTSKTRDSPRLKRRFEVLRKMLPEDPQQDESLQPLPDTLAYKIVNFGDNTTGRVLETVKVLLTLQIPGDRASIYNVEGAPGIMPWHKLKESTKYCTSVARVIGAQFYGASQTVRKALLLFQNDRGVLQSMYDSRFQYELQEEVEEEQAGQLCGRGKCGSGIYFFLSAKSALEYWRAPSGVGHPVLSRKLHHERGLVFDFSGHSVQQDEETRQALRSCMEEKSDVQRKRRLEEVLSFYRREDQAFAPPSVQEDANVACPPNLVGVWTNVPRLGHYLEDADITALALTDKAMCAAVERYRMQRELQHLRLFFSGL